MPLPLEQHQEEISRNKQAWESKPLLRQIYSSFYGRITAKIDPLLPGKVVELGSGIGNLKTHLPSAITTDLFPNPWLDLVCDAYELPFKDASLSHLILFDVFHHLERPFAFFEQAQRVLVTHGRIILFEPYFSLTSSLAYGLFHHEPTGLNAQINHERSPQPIPRPYYAAQANATRLFFRKSRPTHDLSSLHVIAAEAFASFSYLLSGGFSKPALFPSMILRPLQQVDRWLSAVPRLFGARCLIVLEKRC
jgi:hypothetical protein